MDEIKLAIKNITNYDYKKILLRKFFYMIFIDANGRKLYCYIAVVFGGLTTEIDKPESAYKSIKYLTGKDCTLQFEVDTNNEIVEKVTPTNITNSFFLQTEYIEKVWGKCEVLENQQAANKTIKELYPDLYKDSESANIDLTNNTIIKITDKDSQPSHTCIVTKGAYSSNNQPNRFNLSCIGPTEGRRIDGLESMNWVKVVIDLKRNILEEPVLFTITLEENQVFTPDFTWYFAPPIGHVVSAESYVKIGNVAVKNAIQGVSDETTVRFKEWIDPPELISERKKSRVLFKSDEIEKTVNINKLSEKGTISVSLHLDNPQGPTNRQFIYGLFIAFLLSFCSDKTRINDYFDCLRAGCTICRETCNCRTICNMLTLTAPLMILLSFFSITLRKKSIIKSIIKGVKEKRFNLFLVICTTCGIVGVLFALAIMIYIYGLWLIIPEFMRSIISCEINRLILTYGTVVSICTNIIYILYCLFVLKRKIYNSF